MIRSIAALLVLAAGTILAQPGGPTVFYPIPNTGALPATCSGSIGWVVAGTGVIYTCVSGAPVASGNSPGTFPVSLGPACTSSGGQIVGTTNCPTESAKVVYAGPATGAAAAPTWRTLVAGDIPTLIPIANIGTAGLSGTGAVAINAAGAISITGAAGQILAGATPAFTATPALGTDNSVAGTLTLANGSANAHTIWGSAATTSNTILGFAVVPTTNHIPVCVVSSTICTLTDSGALINPANGAITMGSNNILTDPTGSGFVQFSTSVTTQFYLANNTASGQLILRGDGATTILTLGGDANHTSTFAGYVAMSSLPAATGSPSSLCLNGSAVAKNAALTCTVSNESVKNHFAPLRASIDSLMELKPAQFEYDDTPGRMRWGFGANQVASVNRALADGWRADGQPWSLDQNAILALAVKSIQYQQKEINKLKAKRLK